MVVLSSIIKLQGTIIINCFSFLFNRLKKQKSNNNKNKHKELNKLRGGGKFIQFSK